MDDISKRSLGHQIRAIHKQIGEVSPAVYRVAMALYQPADDLLTTFISSTVDGVSLHGYQYRLADSWSLSRIAATRTPRLLTDVPAQLDPSTPHSEYLLGEGVKSSFTVPLVHRDELLGFLFFDSREHDTFTPQVLRELQLHARLLAMAVADDLIAVSSVVGTMQLARDFTALRDYETAEHMDRMARYSRIMARDTAPHFGLDDEDVEHIFLYAPLHDIGKIGVPDHILLKKGPLEPEEWEQMKLHTVKGATMITTILRDLGRVAVPDPTMLRNIVELHHEKLDGSGYPYGLRGASVPPEARIVSAADIFDSLTNDRPYKGEWTFDASVAEMRRQVAVGKLDGACVEALAAARAEVEHVHAAHQAA